MLWYKYTESLTSYVSNTKSVRSNMFSSSSFAYLSIEIAHQDEEFLFREFLYKGFNLRIKLFYFLFTVITGGSIRLDYVFTGDVC